MNRDAGKCKKPNGRPLQSSKISPGTGVRSRVVSPLSSHQSSVSPGTGVRSRWVSWFSPQSSFVSFGTGVRSRAVSRFRSHPRLLSPGTGVRSMAVSWFQLQSTVVSPGTGVRSSTVNAHLLQNNPCKQRGSGGKCPFLGLLMPNRSIFSPSPHAQSVKGNLSKSHARETMWPS